MDAANAAVENGTTMPRVPSMDMPPAMPRRGLSVLGASSLPDGTDTTTLIDAPPASRGAAASPTSEAIMERGTGFIAGAPISRPRPGFVTVPTPSPPSIATAPGGPPGSIDTVATISAP